MSKEQWGHGFAKGFESGMKCNVSFYEFVTTLCIEEDTPQGDLARDILEDGCFPKNTNDKDKLLNHLNYHRACDGTLCAFYELYDEWQKIRNTA